MKNHKNVLKRPHFFLSKDFLKYEASTSDNYSLSYSDSEDSKSSESDFQTVKFKKNNLKRKEKQSHNYSYLSKNSFAPLLETSEESSGLCRKLQIPPFIVHNAASKLEDLLQFTKSISPNLKYRFVSPNKIKMSVQTKEEYRSLKKALENNGINFHTFALPDEKPFRVVLKNISGSTPTQVLEKALANQGHKTLRIVNLYNKRNKKPKNLFFIDLQRKENNLEIFKITRLLNTVVKFEQPYKKSFLVQCKRCQNYGHTQNYCRQPFRCVKCADNHHYRTCSKSKADGKPATCILCGGPHPANYKKCPTYLRITAKKNLETGSSSRKPSYAEVVSPCIQNNSNNLKFIIDKLEDTVKEQQATINLLMQEICYLKQKVVERNRGL